MGKDGREPRSSLAQKNRVHMHRQTVRNMSIHIDKHYTNTQVTCV